ncbi:hypothetical protein COT48_01265 [Candidatus Woesearchaeota archaeon CG08_land_8_20_14_0_20_47_9]|nr:MAG: hypothetical protein COT48_01265 [Candidatus Woesearchaeota archaeon CG08_land_8_20_14_0_20_47_9]HII30242.1 exonuclease SbcCD subunit D [Candidatus Woesearchaeota archaeon]
MGDFSFAHMADCHLGGWRDPKLRALGIKSFEKAVDICLARNVDFVLIAGDLFDTSLPSIDCLKAAVARLKQLSRRGIPVYIVAGSHDFSPSGKSILSVIEEAGLILDVSSGSVDGDKLRLSFVNDPGTGVKVTGLLGRRGMLEKSYYDALDRHALEAEPGFKVFMLHTAISEFKLQEELEACPLSILPKGFNYYAAGHVHCVFSRLEPGYGHIAYPGPVFPNNFKELEELKQGGFYIVDVKDRLLRPEFVPIRLRPVLSLDIELGALTSSEAEARIKGALKKLSPENAIVTLRLKGTLAGGRASDINFRDMFNDLYARGAFFVMKNSSKLHSAEFEEVKVQHTSVEETEQALIAEHLGKIKVEGLDKEAESGLTRELMRLLDAEKLEGQKNADFEARIVDDASEVINDSLLDDKAD